MESSESYSMTKNCKSVTFNDEYSRKLKLTINLTGALIRSHDDYLSDSLDNGLYPDNLSCELVAEAPAGSKIMLLIQSLHIPTDNSLCDENYLYVFDYDSSRSKAMTAAGGEKGLCGRTYPRDPIVTTGPHITIVFNSKIKNHKVPIDAGFMFTLTEIVPVDKTSKCVRDRYRCGVVQSKHDSVVLRRSRKGPTDDGSSWNVQNGITRQMSPTRHTSSGVAKKTGSEFQYCIPRSLVCDGIKNCHDSSDEDSRAKTFCSDLQKVGVITRFLSLGLSASITIAVGCIIVITLCMGLSACYCVRLCTSVPHHQRQVQQTKDPNVGHNYQGMVIAPTGRPGNLDGYYISNFVPPPSACITIRDNSSVSSCDTQNRGFMQISGRPASEKNCNWGTSSMVSYPSNSETHHSHPETPYLTRDPSKNGWNGPNVDRAHRAPLQTSRCHHNSYCHHTPKSSRSGKSTRSTKSTNLDPKNGHQTYPLTFDDTGLVVVGSVLGQV